MKQSTFSAVMAKNLLNVLQGYTKGIRFVAILTMLLTVGIGSAWGATDVILWDGSNPSYQASTTEKTSTDGAIKWVNSAQNTYSNPTRIYSGNTLTISVANTATTKITKIVAVCTSNDYASAFGGTSVNVTGGGTASRSISGSTTTITITGKATAVAMKMSAQSRVSKLTVTYESAAATKLATPTNLKVSDVTTTSAILSWDPVTNASGYTVTVGSTTHNANTNSISLNNLTPSTTYKWSVVAKGNGSTYTDSESAKGSDFTTDTPKKYTVTWMVDKEKLSTEDVYEDGKVSSVPTVTELPCGDKFVGWTTAPITTQQDNAPTVFTTVAGSPDIIETTTFYAVFADYDNE